MSGPELSLSLACYGLSATECVAVASKAEELGFDGIWIGEHLLTPVGYRSEHPYVDPNHPIPVVDPEVTVSDTIAVLGAISAATNRIFIATGIYLLPLRHPLITALSARTIDALSGGRFLLGVGAGWLREEFAALGIDFDARGQLMWEASEIVRLALGGGPISYEGAHYQFQDVLLGHEPVRVPLVFGGDSRGAMRRAARFGDGWLCPSSATIADCVDYRAAMQRLLREESRPSDAFTYHVRVRDLHLSAVEACLQEGFTDISIATLTMWQDPEAVPLQTKLDDLERLAEIFDVGAA